MGPNGPLFLFLGFSQGPFSRALPSSSHLHHHSSLLFSSLLFSSLLVSVFPFFWLGGLCLNFACGGLGGRGALRAGDFLLRAGVVALIPLRPTAPRLEKRCEGVLPARPRRPASDVFNPWGCRPALFQWLGANRTCVGGERLGSSTSADYCLRC